MEQRPEEPVDVGAIERLSFDRVTFRYRGASEDAVDGITFEARLGDTIAFVGPSGSGKSTLVKLLVGLYRPTSGTIAIDDVPANELRYNRVRRRERAAHRLSTIAHADTIFVLERGRIVEQGTHGALVERRGLYFAMWRQQIGERRRETA